MPFLACDGFGVVRRWDGRKETASEMGREGWAYSCCGTCGFHVSSVAVWPVPLRLRTARRRHRRVARPAQKHRDGSRRSREPAGWDGRDRWHAGSLDAASRTVIPLRRLDYVTTSETAHSSKTRPACQRRPARWPERPIITPLEPLRGGSKRGSPASSQLPHEHAII